MRNHYHVGHGIPGYLYDNIATFQYKKWAEQYAKEEADIYREMNWDLNREDKYKIEGTKEKGYYITFGIGGSRSIDIWKCQCQEAEREHAEEYI